MRSVSKHVNSPHLSTGWVFSLVREGKRPFKKAQVQTGIKDHVGGQQTPDVGGGRKKKATLTKGAERKAAALRNA